MEEELEGVPSPGDVVLGKYRVERVLGVGGMGCVVAAQHTTLDQLVAIKFLLAKAAKNPQNVQRFTREAQAAARIRSDHVAKVSDIGALPDGSPYMVMEYLEGEDLADRLTRGGALGVPQAVHFVLQACEALAEAHRAGIVHRDLKPANLFVTQLPAGGQRIKVLDFGISKIEVEPGKGDNLTKTSTLMGSPLYMSPEQMMSAKDADARADIWALGVILYELVAGSPPFLGATLPEICSKILTGPATPLTERAPSAPPSLAAAIERALAKNPDERYQNLAQFALAIAPFGGEPALRSADVVCRVLGHPSASTSPGFGAPHVQGYASTVASGPAEGGAATTPGHGTPPVGGQAVHAVSSSGSVGTYAPPITGAPVTAPGAPVMLPAAMVGVQTEAPVAQTFDGQPRSRRRGVLAVIAAALVVVTALVVVLAMRRSRRHAEAAPASPPSAETASPVVEEPMASAEPVDSADATASEQGSGGAPSTDRGLTTPQPRPRLPRPLRPRANPVDRKGHAVKKGDDLFN